MHYSFEGMPMKMNISLSHVSNNDGMRNKFMNPNYLLDVMRDG